MNVELVAASKLKEAEKLIRKVILTVAHSVSAVFSVCFALYDPHIILFTS
jgi:hypothetical protein